MSYLRLSFKVERMTDGLHNLCIVVRVNATLAQANQSFNESTKQDEPRPCGQATEDQAGNIWDEKAKQSRKHAKEIDNKEKLYAIIPDASGMRTERNSARKSSECNCMTEQVFTLDVKGSERDRVSSDNGYSKKQSDACTLQRQGLNR